GCRWRGRCHGVRPRTLRLYADVDAAAAAEAGVNLGGLDERLVGVGDDELRRGRLLAGAAGLATLAGEGLIAQRELQAVIGGFQAGLLERALELRLLTLQELQRFRAVDGDVRGDLAVAVDVEAHLDAAKLGRIEPDVELVGAGLCPRRNRDR